MKERLKTDLIAVTLIIVILLSAISTALFISFLLKRPEEYSGWSRLEIIVGYANNPHRIDPIDTWDISSQNVECQVIEGLVQYDLSSHPDYQIMGVLATDWHWHGTEFKKISFALRQDVLFHDNTTFDADDVIWNFDRLTWFCNYSGTLPDNVTSWLAFPSSLYWFSDGTTPIIANYYKNDQYNVTFELSRPFAPFLDLLTYVAGYICSPDSTPRWTYLDLTTGKLVGTGPWTYRGYMYDARVMFERWKYYWGELPSTWGLVFDVNEFDQSRNEDMLKFRVDYLQDALPEMLDNFNESGDHVVNRFGEGLCYFYLEFYCGSDGYEGLNVTWRKALQYAVNYTYINDEMYASSRLRGPPAVPRLMPGHNASVQIIDTDITMARTLMQSMGYGLGWDTAYPGTSEADWTGASFRTVQLNRHYGSTTNMRMNQNMDETFALIGVNTNETIRTWSEYKDTGENHPWDMEISYINWCPDYLDAFNMLDPLFNNGSSSNFAHVNDPQLQAWFEEAAQQPDVNLRQQIYMHIQSYLFDVNNPDHKWKYPHAPLFTKYYYIVHASYLKGVSYNPLQILDCWNWYF